MHALALALFFAFQAPEAKKPPRYSAELEAVRAQADAALNPTGGNPIGVSSAPWVTAARVPSTREKHGGSVQDGEGAARAPEQPSDTAQRCRMPCRKQSTVWSSTMPVACIHA